MQRKKPIKPLAVSCLTHNHRHWRMDQTTTIAIRFARSYSHLLLARELPFLALQIIRQIGQQRRQLPIFCPLNRLQYWPRSSEVTGSLPVWCAGTGSWAGESCCKLWVVLRWRIMRGKMSSGATAAYDCGQCERLWMAREFFNPTR